MNWGRGIHELFGFLKGVSLISGLIPLPLSLYYGYNPLKSPKSGISRPPMSSINHHVASKKRKT
jgi:hypothetical protein